MTTVKVIPAVGFGRYQVLADGEVVGEVVKKVTRYNLRRVYVSTVWYGTLSDDDRTRVPAQGGYDTRRDAVAALLKAAGVEA